MSSRDCSVVTLRIISVCLILYFCLLIFLFISPRNESSYYLASWGMKHLTSTCTNDACPIGGNVNSSSLKKKTHLCWRFCRSTDGLGPLVSAGRWNVTDQEPMLFLAILSSFNSHWSPASGSDLTSFWFLGKIFEMD